MLPMKREELLEQVRLFTDKAHGEQMRKYSPERYIVHPIRVMKMVSEYIQDPAVLSAAILHDVLEDTAVSKQELKTFLYSLMADQQAEKALNIVVELTDIYTKENYPQYNRRKRKRLEADRIKKASAESHTIKYADIIDNVPEITEHDPDFAARFNAECLDLLYHMKKGVMELREKAFATVNDCMKVLKTNIQ
jgi:guanosine-3',5'-bis(diphosphate) 3'-pyrophosphohydrolase